MTIKYLVQFHHIILPVRVAFADWEKIIKVWSVAVAVVAGVVAAARVEVVVVTMAVVLVSPLTLYRPSATVLFHFVLLHSGRWTLKNL